MNTEQCYLYVVFSAIPNKMGKLIRTVTGCPYNHASIALDASLSQMYSFARRFYHTPFYGGFVKESLSRYHIAGQAAKISVYRLSVTKAQYQQLEIQLAEMLQTQDQYLYNHLSALAVPFHRRVKIRDTSICVDFVSQMLSTVGITPPDKYFSVSELEAYLHSYHYFSGSAPEAPVYDAAYYSPKPVPRPVITTAQNFIELVRRLLE